ncbi:hypothetical protein LZF95_20980 [Algoriphagus sp. AGSA1]|uniref:hypothetical protein n=1 Tax=Algoriphagus sp. AGSA1 TaxID=2907213 RepID=UPI001F37014C|nr:hypothetical protein [Algoriphagus sp. AGSA1]MCE7057168.1 hypothetical protein [Algoriphagus sp. AGSA1]
MDNELVIRQINTGVSDVESCRHGAYLLTILMDGFLEMIAELRDGIETGKELAGQLLLLLGDCNWSEENALRYGTTINGFNKN